MSESPAADQELVDLSSAKLVHNADTVDGVQGGREVVG